MGRGSIGIGDEEKQTTMYKINTKYYEKKKINKLQGYIIQHRKYNQYFIITINGV